MRVDPTLDEVVSGDRGMLRGIEAALDAQCLVSALTLMFATIDALAALTRPPGATDTSSSVFIDWTQRFLDPQKRLRCSAEDLYSARCGVLHTYSVESSRVRSGSARPLVYEWRGGPPANATVPLPDGAITLEVESLHSALTEAIAAFMRAADGDPDIRARVESHLPELLCYSPWPRMVVASVA